jgi:hypothetical protein
LLQELPKETCFDISSEEACAMSTKRARTKRRSEMGEVRKKAKVVSPCGRQYLCLHCLFNGFKDKSPNSWEDARKCPDRAITTMQQAPPLTSRDF